MRRHYFEARYEVTDLSPRERDSLAGELAAMAERSDEHPSVELEMMDTIELWFCDECGRAIDEGHDLCESCETQRRYEVSEGVVVEGVSESVVVRLSGAEVVGVSSPGGLPVEVRQYHADHAGDPPQGEDDAGRYHVAYRSAEPPAEDDEVTVLRLPRATAAALRKLAERLGLHVRYLRDDSVEIVLRDGSGSWHVVPED